MKKNKVREQFLAELRRIPIVQVACEKSGISRTSVYQWRKKDQEFVKDMDEALTDGEVLVNDMTESQLLTLIKEKNWQAMSFWLRHRNPRFKDKVEISGTVITKEELTPEDRASVERVLKQVSLDVVNQKKKEIIGEIPKDHEPADTK